MKIKSPLYLIDFYKADHRRQYPDNTVTVYSNFTPRSNKYAYEDSNEVVVFGIQYLIKEYLIDQWNEGFFNRSRIEVVEEYQSFMDRCLGPGAIPVDHIIDLHNLGYLPIKIKSLPEGTLCPIGVPVLTIVNTEPKFFWLTNYLETLLSNILWKPMTSATTAHLYRKEFERHAELTGSPKDFIGWQGHDFSFRGMSGVEDACLSGMGHLLSFNGTDTVPAIVAAMNYYPTEEFIGGSVPATEHSVMCMGGDGVGEFETFKRLITETYPSGIVSIVSDTWDFWKVMTDYLPRLKDEIEARDGRVVIRPDSGDPVDIICGLNSKYPRFEGISEDYLNDFLVEAEEHEGEIFFAHGSYWKIGDVSDFIAEYGYDNYSQSRTFSEMKSGGVSLLEEVTVDEDYEFKGAYEILWDIFGGTTNDNGYKVLNPKVGLIYGDSINYDRQKDILARLEAKKFTASNLVLGIGSFTYEYVTRDTYGFAMKATYGEVEEEFFATEESTEPGVRTIGREIYKDPKTDSGLKKSAKGLLCVGRNCEGKLTLIDQATETVEDVGELDVVFEDGKLVKEVSFEDVRKVLRSM